MPVWGGLRYTDLYPGIDLEITGEKGQMVERVVARANADLNAVRLRVDGADKIALEGERLIMSSGAGKYTMPLLEVDSSSNAKLSPSTVSGDQVSSPFTKSPISLQKSAFSNTSSLIYGTFLGGGSDDHGYGIAVDSSGVAYVTGHTESTNFPTTPGAFDTTSNSGYFGGTDAFVVKLNVAGSAPTYATFLGGSENDQGSGIAVDSTGAAYVTGGTLSPDFPTTQGAFDTACGTDGNCNFDGTNHYADVFLAKLNGAGSALTYATFLGGSDEEYGYGISTDSSGAAYITGLTHSSDFPTTPGAFDTSYNGGWDPFVAKLSIPIIAAEDNDASIQYNGWHGVIDANANGGSYRISNVLNDKVSFKFKATSVKWLTGKGPNMGKALVTIDGINKGTFDLYSPTKQLFTQTFSGLANVDHNVIVKVLHQKRASATDFSVAVDGFVVGSTTTQDTNCAIKYNTWTCATNVNASGGSYHFATAAGSIASLTFTGGSIDWIGEVGPNYGKATVTINGSSACPPSAPCTIDLYDTTANWQVMVKSFTGLGGGQHTIQIKPAHTKNANSTGYRVAVDAFTGPITPLTTAVQVAAQPLEEAGEDPR